MGVTQVSDLADVCRYRHQYVLQNNPGGYLFTHFMSATSGIISIYDNIVKFYAFQSGFLISFENKNLSKKKAF